MSRMPVLSREEMTPAQQKAYDHVKSTTGRVGRGPGVGFIYSPALWLNHNDSGEHHDNCSLSKQQVRIAALMTVRHWNAAYPWSAQASAAKNAGMSLDAIEAMNDGKTPKFDDPADALVHRICGALLATGSIDDALFNEAKSVLGLERLADVVGVVGHFTATAMMANVAGVEWPDEAVSTIRR